MKKLLIIIFTLLSNTTFAQSALADLKFEEAETAFNSQDYETTIEKLDEFDKLLGSIKDKSLYLRIISQDKLFDPTKLYENESQFNILISLRKNTSAYLKAMESSGLDDRYREVYVIHEKLLNYPKDKTIWLKEKQKLDSDKEEIKKKEEETEKYYREIAPKIDAWEWSEGIKIGGNFEELKKKYPELYKGLSKKKDFYISKISKPETLSFVSLDYPNKNNIRYYIVDIYISKSENFNDKEKEMKFEMDKLKQKFKITFGDSLIFENDNDVIFTISSPYSKYKIEVLNDYFSIRLIKSK